MYPFLTLDDGTEIVHSEMHPDGQVKVYMERPDPAACFHHTACWLPSYTWEDVEGFSPTELDRLHEVVKSTAHLILRFARDGGFDRAASF